MCGTGRPAASAKRRTLPGITPRHTAPPSSDCFIQQLHAQTDSQYRLAQGGNERLQLVAQSLRIASAAAPTPGRITWLPRDLGGVGGNFPNSLRGAAKRIATTPCWRRRWG